MNYQKKKYTGVFMNYTSYRFTMRACVLLNTARVTVSPAKHESFTTLAIFVGPQWVPWYPDDLCDIAMCLFQRSTAPYPLWTRPCDDMYNVDYSLSLLWEVL